MAKKNNKFNRQNFMKMIGYTPDPKNENYAYYFPNIDDNKELFDNSDIASLAFTQSEYQCDTNKATKGISFSFIVFMRSRIELVFIPPHIFAHKGP